MHQILFNRGLTKYISHIHRYSHFTRLSNIDVRNDKFCCSVFCAHPAPERWLTIKTCSNYSTYNGGSGKQEYKDRSQQSTALGTLVGALGTIAVLGLGTIFSESQEKKKELDDEATQTTLQTHLKNETQEGTDVVGRGKTNRNKGAFVNTDQSFHKEEKDSQEVVQIENASELEECVRKARQILRRHMEEVGAPGLVIGVTVNGKQIWTDGFGFADLENGVRCSPRTVMRIASISKSLTMTAVARLWEKGKLDLDAPIQKYIPNFPIKTYNGEEVTITTRHLLSHQSGIRHYRLKNNKEKQHKKKGKDQSNVTCKTQNQTSDHTGTEASTVANKNEKTLVSQESVKERETITIGNEADEGPEEAAMKQTSEKEDVLSNKTTTQEETKSETRNCTCKRGRRKIKKKVEEEDEFDLQEYFIKEEYETIQDALQLFQNDDLFFKPGEGYLYTTHGWTLVSAVLEGAVHKPFTVIARKLFYELGLDNTYLDEPLPIIRNRAKYYFRDKFGKLKNAPYVDNSYKWAGGGFLSTVEDLCKFGNAMLYASQQEGEEDGGDTPKRPGYLKASTVQQLWTIVNGTGKGWRNHGYGMGWQPRRDKQQYQFCRKSRYHAFHCGGAVGASSILLVLPLKEPSTAIPQGVVVSILTNMQGVNLYKVAYQIAELFETCH